VARAMEIKLKVRYNHKIEVCLAVETPITIHTGTVHPIREI